MKLYEITSIMRALMDTLSDLPLNEDGKPLNADDQAQHDAAMQAFQGTAEDMRIKVRAMVAYALELRTEREARQAMMDAIANNVLDKMDKANQRDLKKETWLLTQVHGSIQAVGLPTPCKFPEFSINMQKLPNTAEIVNAEALPAEYLREIAAVAASTAPDKKKILSDLKDGVVISGAALSKDAYNLVIK